MLVKSFYEKEEEKRRKKEDDEIRLFRRSVSQLPRTQRYVCKCFCELLGSIILSASWFGVVASLAIIWVIHNYGKFKISIVIPKYIENATTFSDDNMPFHVSLVPPSGGERKGSGE